MPNFLYSYLNTEGIRSVQNLVAPNRKQALIILKKKGIIPLNLEESIAENPVNPFLKIRNIWGKKSEKNAYRREKPDQKLFKKTISSSKGEKIGMNVLKRLYELHKSGMPIGDAVKILKNRFSDKKQKALVNQIWRDLSEGLTLAKALSKQPYFFTPSICIRSITCS